jgi:putative flippase GtrA
MVFSFFANRRFVFSAAGGSVKRQAILFLLATAFSMYVLQTLVIYALSTLFPWTLAAAVTFGRWIGFRSDTAALLIRSNAAKLGATVASTIWNYSFYRWMVFNVTKQ